jgi:coatomer protein complex subunit gamma
MDRDSNEPTLLDFQEITDIENYLLQNLGHIRGSSDCQALQI